MRRSELRDDANRESPAMKMARGALAGATMGPLVIVLFFLFEAAFDLLFRPSMWNLGTLRIAGSLLVAGAAAGAFSGAIISFFRHPARALHCVVPVSGGLGGAVFWLVQRPPVSLTWCVVSGVVIVTVLLLMALAEDRRETRQGRHPQPPADLPEMSIACPRCRQQTRNFVFCEVCGKDLRTKPPPLVLPDGSVEGAVE